MTKSVTFCDGCGRTKLESNHWIAMREFVTQERPTLQIFNFETSRETDRHYCGFECAQKAFNAFVERIREDSNG